MAENIEDKRYYWLKLKNDFFERPEIRYVEVMQDGKEYILFYLKLLCKSVEYKGLLKLNDNIPYNLDMLSIVTNTDRGTIEKAIEVFTNLKMMELMDDGTYFMLESEKMMGSETYWAERKRQQRAKQDKTGQCPSDVPTLSSVSKEEREIDLETDLYSERETENAAPLPSDEGFIDWAWKKIKSKYPREDGAEAAKPLFVKFIEQVPIEDRDTMAHRLQIAVIMYHSDYDEKNPDDAENHTYVNGFSRWFREDFDKYMGKATEYQQSKQAEQNDND